MRPLSKLNDKEATALEMREKGETFAAIGAALGVSRSQAAVLFSKATSAKDAAASSPKHEAPRFLGVRAANILRNNKIDVRAPDAHLAVSRIPLSEIRKWPNMGSSSIQQVRDWLLFNGLDFITPDRPHRAKRCCPHCGGEI
jgi:hypothetical protein